MELIEKAQKGSEEAVETLVEKNTRLVWSMVQRFKTRGYDIEDLFQIGAIGLIKSIHKFNPTFGVKFSTYSVPMIIGEIQRFIRDDGTVKVSRSIKEIAQKIRTGDLLDKTPEEISKILEVDSMELIKTAIQYIRKGTVKSMDEVVYNGKDGGSDEITIGDQLQGDINGDNWLEHMALRSAMDNLSPREQKIVQLRYFQDMTQSEVANVLKISQVQVSRLEKRILLEMKKLMDDKEEETNMARQVKGDRKAAVKLLSGTEMTYQEIADETGVPFGTVAHLSKEHRPKEVIEKIKRDRAQALKKEKQPVEVAFELPKSRPIQEEPVVTPVINHPAFMGDKDLKATASQHLFIDGDEIVVAKPGTLEEMYRVKDTTRPTLAQHKVTEPVIVKVGTETGRLDVSKSHVSNVPKSEEPKKSAMAFSFKVEVSGKDVSKTEVLDNLMQAMKMVQQSPSDSVSFQVKITN